jgi:cobaltochelatase CobT
MSGDNPIESFRQVLTGASRALAQEAELELGFTAGRADRAGQVGQGAAARPDAAGARGRRGAGLCDAAALKLRHHNAGLHSRGQPLDETARAVFNAAEQARVEALGARAMAGVRANLARATEMRMRTDPIARARNRAEVPLSTAVSLMIRERLTGEAPPKNVRAGLELVSDWIEERAAPISTRWGSRSTTSAPLRASPPSCSRIWSW